MTETRILTWDELYDETVQYLKDDENLHAEALESLDSWNGYLNDDRWYSMSEFDDLMYGRSPREVAEKITSDFNINDEYFRFTICGLESSDDIDYSDYDEAGTLDNLIANPKVDVRDNALNTAVEALSQGYTRYEVNDDLGTIEGIDEDEDEE